MWDFSGGQWLGLCASTAEGTGLIPGGEPRSLILHGMAKKKKGTWGTQFSSSELRRNNPEPKASWQNGPQ